MAAHAAMPPTSHATAATVHALLQAASTAVAANRSAQAAAVPATSRAQPSGHTGDPATRLDGETAEGAPADLQSQTPGDVSAPAASPVDTDPATLLTELRTRHPPRETAPVPAAPMPRDNGGNAELTAAAPRPLRRATPAGDAAAQAPSPAGESAVVGPPRQPSSGTIDAPPVTTGAAAAEASVPPPALAPAAPPQPALPPPPTLPAAAAAPVVEARLPATPGSTDFSTQLGAQITTFVRDGVQHARLHLNPAEMGPVTVRIQVDGQSAQVHLAAEHALTRQALEQSMPLLAGSLREAGLTLSGGGVFEQPRQPRRWRARLARRQPPWRRRHRRRVRTASGRRRGAPPRRRRPRRLRPCSGPWRAA